MEHGISGHLILIPVFNVLAHFKEMYLIWVAVSALASLQHRGTALGDPGCTTLCDGSDSDLGFGSPRSVVFTGG